MTTITPEFTTAYATLMAHEGGYSNSPLDRGGETYRGISRVHHPDWQGWPMVDAGKSKQGFPVSLEGNALLQTLVRVFYKASFWDHFYGDSLPFVLATEIFEQAVNLGTHQTTLHIQRVCNFLNRNGRLFADLKEDGRFGKLTLQALVILVHSKDMGDLIKSLNVLQGAHYIELAAAHHEQEEFARGWLKRVELSKAA